MTSFDHDLNGLSDHIEDLIHEQERWGGGGTWYVGTRVEYSIYVEFGTSKMDARTYFRPAINEVNARGPAQFIEDNTTKRAEQIDNIDEFVRTLALALERRVKEIITAKGIIDTGLLRASITAVPRSTAFLPDPESLDPDPNASVEDSISRDVEVEV